MDTQSRTFNISTQKNQNHVCNDLSMERSSVSSWSGIASTRQPCLPPHRRRSIAIAGPCSPSSAATSSRSAPTAARALSADQSEFERRHLPSTTRNLELGRHQVSSASGRVGLVAISSSSLAAIKFPLPQLDLLPLFEIRTQIEIVDVEEEF
ncbi:unnamed protein product [Linum tenue]|uniref:Uncharacterized protein n=1 Tax=Linum tenue TaxID=586396 RepID=A0AAV0NKT0_9ROSI|nr:unnamed protein product [Linum tenue]